jgi:hypothetical protein
MSRPMWSINIQAQLINGTSGSVNISAENLVTIRELRQQLDRALAMCEALAREPAQEEKTNWKPSVVA